jgi:hypothetical protein
MTVRITLRKIFGLNGFLEHEKTQKFNLRDKYILFFASENRDPSLKCCNSEDTKHKNNSAMRVCTHF